LPSNDKGIHTQTHRLMEGFFNYGVEMGSVTVIYSFVCVHKDSFRRSKVNGGGIHTHTHTHTHKHTHGQQRDLISLLYFFKIGK
jgi:hypothetical protein